MFVKDQDGRFDIQIALDDFIELSTIYDKSEIEAKLRVAIHELEKRLYWYKILLEGLEKDNNRNKETEEEIKQFWSK